MNNRIKWRKKTSNLFFHEEIVIGSFSLLIIVLGFDSFFQKLPFSGYGLILITLLLIGFTTCATLHSIKWAISSNKPLLCTINRKSQYEKWMKPVKTFDERLFRKLMSSFGCLESFKYPTSLNEQIRLLIKDIERDFVKTWYSDISQNPSFLFDSHLILEEFFFKIARKLKTVNSKNLLSDILMLYLNHLQEFKKSIKKTNKLNQDRVAEKKIEISNVYRCIHPGSQSNRILDYYLKKVSSVILKEFSSIEFSNSLECKILSGIIGKKVMKTFLSSSEDPNWINIKLIYLLDPKKHEELMQNRIYSVEEKFSEFEEEEVKSKSNQMFLGKKFFPSNLFDSKKNLFDQRDFKGENSSGEREEESNSLTSTVTKCDETKGNISTVLSGLISSTAGPLLPENISVRYKALNKMWQSPVSEVKDFSESITCSFRKVFVNGVKEKKCLIRSKSTDSLVAVDESNFRKEDISVGEDLCFESCGRSECESVIVSKKPPAKKLTKTHSFDEDSLMMAADEPDGCVSGPDEEKNVSPVYEEPEDFATTIAKLRSLLQQRESSSTMSDKSNASLDSADKSNSSNKSQSFEGDAFHTQIACDVPADGRLFVNVSIPKGELVTESGISHVVYTIQYDGIYMVKEDQISNSEPEFVLQTTLVKRRFRDFLYLQMKLEENGNLRAAMKGIKGPSKWLNVPASGCKPEEVPSPSRKSALETFLRQICAKVEISNCSELHEFLAYGQTGNDALVRKDPTAPTVQRIDKLLANKFTGVFNSIKTVLPSFDFDSTATAAFIATNDTVKGIQEQKLLQGFLNFGNKQELANIKLNFAAREQTGDSLADDIRHWLSRKSDCIEDAVDVLDTNDWLSDQKKECRFVSSEATCVWEDGKQEFFEDELESLDSWLTASSLVFDIFSELLQESGDAWIVKEPVVRLIKFAFGHWESRFEETFSKLDWDRISGNLIRLFRSALSQSTQQKQERRENARFDPDETRFFLEEIILDLMPGWIEKFVKPEGLQSAVSLFVDSFQHFRLNRDVLLRLMDILLIHSLSCRHLISIAPK